VDWLMKEFRDRVLIPLLIPLGALAIIAVIVLNISRVLLALEERSGPHTVVVVAIVVASTILFGCTYFASRSEERSAGNMSLLSVAGIMIIAAGFIGFEAIQEDTTKANEEAAKNAPAKPDLIVEAFDLGFKEKELKIGPGKVTIEEINTGNTGHTLVIDGAVGKKLSVPAHDAKDLGTYDLKAGTYTYYCDIPGHRQAGMEGKLTVDPSAPPPGSGGGGAAAGTPAKIDAADLSYTPKELTVPAGPVSVTLNNIGKIQHTLVVEGEPTFKKLTADPGQSPNGTFTAKAGTTYTFYCDIPGHRAAGMQTTVKVA
jgi:plastocyanin